MIRTQIQLTEHQYERLRERASRTRQSIAEQIRQAIDLYFRVHDERRPRVVADVAGRYSPRDDVDGLKDHDLGFVRAIELRREGNPRG